MIQAANKTVLPTSQGRLDSNETAALLGFEPHDIPVLSKAGLLKPLGHPAPSAPKYFALVQIMELAADAKWLAKATDTLTEHWRSKNARRSKEPAAKRQG